MKVLHLIDSEGLFGAEMVLLHLIREHAKLGIESVLGSLTSDGSEAKSLDTAADESGINVKKFHVKKGLDILGALRMARFAREGRFDLIHCHGYKPDILMGMLTSSSRGLPYLVTFHGWTATQSFSRIGAYGWLDAARRLCCYRFHL